MSGLGMLTRFGLSREDATPPVGSVGITLNSGYPSTGASGGNQFGWLFTVGANDLRVTHLRIYTTAIAHTARLWAVAGSALLANVSIVGGAPAWAEEPITPATLSAGQDYVVTMRPNGGLAWQYEIPADDIPDAVVWSPHLTFVQGRFVGDNNFPKYTTGYIRGLPDIRFTVL